MSLKRVLRRVKIFVVDPLRIRFFPPRSLNVHIYDEVKRKGLPRPDIETHVAEQYGQCGEDVIVCGILRGFALQNGLDLSRFCFCEIGANHPVSTSSTYLLAKALAMKGLLVEANPKLIGDLVRVRPESKVVNIAVSNRNLDEVSFYVSNQSEISSLSRDRVQSWRDGSVGEREMIRVPCTRYDDLIERYLQGEPPLFVSIDIEGHDLEVLRDANLDKYGPLLLQLEAPDHRPETTEMMISHMKAGGYSILAKTFINIIFIKQDVSFWTGKKA